MNNNINKISTSKKRRILIYSNDEEAKISFFKKISECHTIYNNKSRDHNDITFEINFNKKNSIIKLTDSLNSDTSLNSIIDFSYIYRNIYIFILI